MLINGRKNRGCATSQCYNPIATRLRESMDEIAKTGQLQQSSTLKLKTILYIHLTSK